MSRNWFEFCSSKLEVVRSAPLIGAWGKDFYREEAESKPGYYLIAYGLSSCLIWKSLVGCLWLIVLRFRFLNLEALTNLDFGLLMWAAKALEPPQSSGLTGDVWYLRKDWWEDLEGSEWVHALGRAFMDWPSFPGCGLEPTWDCVVSPVAGRVCLLNRVVSMADWTGQRAEVKGQRKGQDSWSWDTKELGPVHPYSTNTRAQEMKWLTT